MSEDIGAADVFGTPLSPHIGCNDRDREKDVTLSKRRFTRWNWPYQPVRGRCIKRREWGR